MFEITLIQKYVEKLVLNSIQENATCIAVRLDWMNKSLQVIDNGRGIGLTQLQLFCSRIVNNNDRNVENRVVNHLEEVLEFIIQLCSSLEIESQVKNSNAFYKRYYQNGIWSDVEYVGTRSTSGTTVSVFDFFTTTSEETFYLNIKSVEKLIASFFLLHSHISFSLRVHSSKIPLLQTKKVKNTMLAAQQLFKSRSIIPFHGHSHYYKIKGLFVSHMVECSWFVFVNSQLVESKEIVDLITSVLLNVSLTPSERFAIILNIKCSRAICKFTTDSDGNRGVVFLKWNELLSLVQNSLKQFISHVPIKKSAFVSRWLISFYGDGDLTNSRLTSSSLDCRPENTGINKYIEEKFLSPLPCDQSGSSEQSFYGKIAQSLLIPFVSQASEDFEIRIKESPKDCLISSSELLLISNHLATFWEEVEEKAESIDLTLESHEANGSLSSDKTTNNSTVKLLEESTQIQRYSPMDSLKSLGQKRKYPSTNNDIRFNSKRKFKIGQNFTTSNTFWVQPKMPLSIAVKNFSGLITSALQKECKFTKSVMANIRVVSQVDRKFICCVTQEEKKRFLLLIDQHAAHERVCLERLVQMHSTKNDAGYIQVLSSPLHPHLKLSFPFEDLLLIKKLRVEFTRYGLHLQFSNSNIIVTRVPSCFLAREMNEIQRKRSSLYKGLVLALIEETIAEYTKNGRLTTCILPIQILNVLNSLACHGAIKFGDELSLTQCAQLIRALAQCDMPFQCAHGRPLLAPLLELGGLTSLLVNPDIGKPKYARLMNYDLS